MMVSSVLTEEPICTKYAVQDKLVDVVFELEHQVDTLKRALKNVQHQLNTYQLTMDMSTAALATRVDGLDTKLTAEDKRIEEKLTMLTNGLPSRITSMMTGLCSTTLVAFQAFLSINIAFPQVKVVTFNEVPVNIGNAYNATTGIFTAPVNGTYLFSMTIGNPTGNPGAMMMKKNNEDIGYAIAGHTTGWNQGSQTTVVRMSVGDVMFVEGEGHVSGNYAGFRKHSSITGILINNC
ncbi:hypothetical protein DPMN_099130 [Dreissena polymorpha]|uniref:C1q domain-containing protein n=2 Tax=Dreissena polymorpha TaxID=45954 RepID=A0A9D4LEB7_DREPO|nr:hypothetical protein DPMN_099130 [Dreissena polymorpha]